MRARALRSVAPRVIPETRLRIGALAQATGVAVDTIRYYERQGLIDAPPRRGAEHRLYPAETVERLNLIRKTRQLGFALPVVRELIALLNSSAATPGTDALLAEIDARLKHLTMLREVVLQNGRGVPAGPSIVR